ncbi:MAG: type 1 glutamine amidotransferase [Deltaproteobacteria bacterium]|nr:type 1 glutamine amidotransferase [Deltaproteobacteria bacterium]
MRIACLLADGFEDSEFRDPYDSFLFAGHEVLVIGSEARQELKGKKGRERFTTDKSIAEVRPEEFDALFIPGGHSPDKLRGDPRFVEFTKGFARKPIFAICHGPQLLMTADMVKGKTLTAWKTVQSDLRHTGAHVVDREVVVDGNLVTSRMPDDIDAFTRESLKLLVNGRTSVSEQRR